MKRNSFNPVGRKFVKGKLVGTLKVTQKEGAGYRWVGCLALLSDTGQWMHTESWRTNRYIKAYKELTDAGWSITRE